MFGDETTIISPKNIDVDDDDGDNGDDESKEEAMPKSNLMMPKFSKQFKSEGGRLKAFLSNL